MPTSMKLTLLPLWMLSCNCIRFSVVLAAATSTISTGQRLTSSDTLVSSGGIFELGFFSRGNSPCTYLGIWYKKTEERTTIVWVGNRDQPLTTSSPCLAIDGANLVIQGGRTTYHLGYSRKTGKVWVLTSWKNAVDPSPGDFSLRIDSESPDEFVILKGPRIRRSGNRTIHLQGVRRILLRCEQMGYGNGDKDGFLKMDHVTFALYYSTSERISTKACKSACSGDCSCTAYAYSGSGTGTGRCLLWHEDLLNLRQLSEDDPNSNTIYIKLAAYELQNSRGRGITLILSIYYVTFLQKT
ncbi:hypothetical protein NL676_027264 [Syzygium grande]|nr:hypothetical protein NL676_027264 [Syzygium grande]